MSTRSDGRREHLKTEMPESLHMPLQTMYSVWPTEPSSEKYFVIQYDMCDGEGPMFDGDSFSLSVVLSTVMEEEIERGVSGSAGFPLDSLYMYFEGNTEPATGPDGQMLYAPWRMMRFEEGASVVEPIIERRRNAG